MRKSQQTRLLGGLLICGMGLVFPGISYVVTGCSNSSLMGTYAADVANGALLSALTATSSSSAANFATNPFAPTSTSIPRFFFDGQGNILALGSTASTIPVGTYSVNPNCSATMTFTAGATFNAVIVAGGSGILYIQNNAGGGGAVGSLQLSTRTCLANSQQSFGFSFFSAQRFSSASAALQPLSGIGSVTLDGQGGFAMQEWLYQNGATTTVNLTGTYTVGTDCSLSLTFTPTSGGTATASITAPVSFTGGLMMATTGLITVQSAALSTATGPFISQ